MKISKKLREDAALICEIVGNARFDGRGDTEGEVADALGYTFSSDAWYAVKDLAARAFCVIPDFAEDHTGAEWLEAAALLRDGWIPGETPVLLDETAQEIVETLGAENVESITITRGTEAIDVDDEEYEEVDGDENDDRLFDDDAYSTDGE